MRWFYEAGYDYGRNLPLPKAVHGFLRDKPTRIRRELERLGALKAGPCEIPGPHEGLPWERVHSSAQLEDLHRSEAIARATEFGPVRWLPAWLARRAVVVPQLRAAAGTVAAVEAASRGAWCVNLSGGFHHARPDLSHGFCLVNDVAVAVAALAARGERPRILVLDVDLHQGDGNAAAFADVDHVFTASIHQASAFPHPKLRSDLDVELADGEGDGGCLRALDRLLGMVQARFVPEVVVVVAGTDVLAQDGLGSLRMTVDGVVDRERRIARFAAAHGAGLVVLPGGGYSALSPTAAAQGYAAMAALEP